MPSRTRWQPKLRSSCDSCGAAKLKCDRDRPQCGRCHLRGQACVYGVSRKMGKPPRDKLRLPVAPSRSRTQGQSASSIDRERRDDMSRTSSTSVSFGDGIFLGSGPFSTINESSSSWNAIDDCLNGLARGVDAPEPLNSNLLGPSPLDFTSLKFDDDIPSTDVDDGPISKPESPGLEGFSTHAAHTKPSQAQVKGGVYPDSTFMPLANSKDHDCSREAYHILGRLSFLKVQKAGYIPPSAPSSVSTTASTAHRMAFDHILRLNRDSAERLSRLLTCSCARCPHLALLYASIISLTLTRYQQAAGCTERFAWRSANAAADQVLHYVSPSGSISGSQPSWSSTSVSGTSTPALIEPDTSTVAPTQLVIGSFNVDDQQMQIALKTQLLLGEMKRIGPLIDLFASWSSGGDDESTFGTVDSLYKSLTSWLRREHSKTVDAVRFRLRELGA